MLNEEYDEACIFLFLLAQNSMKKNKRLHNILVKMDDKNK